MKKSNFSKIDGWYKDGHIQMKSKQVSELMKHYDYSDGDWVLWIVSELYEEHSIKQLIGDIEILKTDGSAVSVSFVSRQPYPNKRIHHLSMKSSRKRLYGIPLVFKSFEDLKSITDVKIKWSLYQIAEDTRTYKPLLLANTLSIVYHIDLVPNPTNPDYRFFTLHSKDHAFSLDSTSSFSEYDQKYIDEFKNIVVGTGNGVLKDDNWMFEILESFYIKNSKDTLPIAMKAFADHKPDSSEVNFINFLITKDDSDNGEYQILRKSGEYVKATIKKPVLWRSYYLESSETLTAEFMGDLMGL